MPSYPARPPACFRPPPLTSGPKRNPTRDGSKPGPKGGPKANLMRKPKGKPKRDPRRASKHASRRPEWRAQVREMLATAGPAELAAARADCIAQGIPVPSNPAVADRLLERRRQAEDGPSKRARKRALLAANEADGGAQWGPRVAAWAATYLAEHGEGPMWGEIGGGLGLERGIWPVLFPRLIKMGWVTSTLEARSTRPGPRWHP